MWHNRQPNQLPLDDQFGSRFSTCTISYARLILTASNPELAVVYLLGVAYVHEKKMKRQIHVTVDIRLARIRLPCQPEVFACSCVPASSRAELDISRALAEKHQK